MGKRDGARGVTRNIEEGSGDRKGFQRRKRKTGEAGKQICTPDERQRQESEGKVKGNPPLRGVPFDKPGFLKPSRLGPVTAGFGEGKGES